MDSGLAPSARPGMTPIGFEFWNCSTRVPRMRGAHATSHRPLVEEIVDLAGGLGADSRHLGEVGGGGTLDRLERPEVTEQRTLAGRPDAGDLLQTRLADIAPSPCAVRPDGEPVRLV